MFSINEPKNLNLRTCQTWCLGERVVCCVCVRSYLAVSICKQTKTLSALNTFGNCQRPVISLGVSQHIWKQNKTVKFWTQWFVKVARKKRKKKTRHTKLFVFRCLNSNYFSEKSLLSLLLFRGSCFPQWYQPLSIARYLVSFYADNYYD